MTSGIRKQVTTRLLKPRQAKAIANELFALQQFPDQIWYGAARTLLNIEKHSGRDVIEHAINGDLARSLGVGSFKGSYCAWIEFPMPEWLNAAPAEDECRLRRVMHCASAKQAMLSIESDYARSAPQKRLLKPTIASERTSKMIFAVFEPRSQQSQNDHIIFLVPLITADDHGDWFPLDPDLWTEQSEMLVECASYIGFAVVNQFGLAHDYGVAPTSRHLN